MCGIVAASSSKDIVPFVTKSLAILEYRGYDSAGIAVTHPLFTRIRTVGRVSTLVKKMTEQNLHGTTGVAHTRWATHGELKESNTHPLVYENILLVHNGVVENLKKLKEEFPPETPLSSETDSEFIAALIVWWQKKEGLSTLDAIREVINLIKGSFALAIVDRQTPQTIYLTKRLSPLVIAKNEDGCFAASDPVGTSIISENVIDLHDEDIACCSLGNLRIVDRNQNPIHRLTRRIKPFDCVPNPSQHTHFMKKEISEQPKVIENIIDQFIKNDHFHFSSEMPDHFWTLLKSIENIYIIGCGSSYHAAMVAKTWFEDIAGIHTEICIASQFEGKHCEILKNCLVIFISQSGETADTLAALTRLPNNRSPHTLALCNVETSSLAQKTNFLWPMKSGLEISVASTKTFTAQLTALLLMAVAIGIKKQGQTAAHTNDICTQIRNIPSATQHLLTQQEPLIIDQAKRMSQQENIIFLGKAEDYPLALEAALKMKELTYLHAEGYPSGEFKHGPLAMVESRLLIVFLATNPNTFEKIRMNYEQVRARCGKTMIISVGETISGHSDNLVIDPCPPLARSFCMSVFLQLLAYHTARERGLEIDKPRNLAKSVTVE